MSKARISMFTAMLAIFGPTPSNAKNRLTTVAPLLPGAQIRAASPLYLSPMSRMAAGSIRSISEASGWPDDASTEDHTLF